jgi:hypothetical protein
MDVDRTDGSVLPATLLLVLVLACAWLPFSPYCNVFLLPFGASDCDSSAVLAFYNQCAGFPSVDGCAAAVMRDYIFTCPTRRAAAAHASASTTTKADDEVGALWATVHR